jgi:hypothetical protein
MMQTTSHVLMIRPVNFNFNPETAVNNAFQSRAGGEEAQDRALSEFDGFVNRLCGQGVDVTVVKDTALPYTPDSIFPNNWISFHADGTICLFPMYAVNRRQERKPDFLEAIAAKFRVTRKIDLSHYEKENLFLEGTGSMVLDRENKIAYACLSPRTNNTVLEDFCEKMGYTAIMFQGIDGKGLPIYHTNVMMCVADSFVVICLDLVPEKGEREKIIASMENTGKEIIDIGPDQMNHFAGNMLQLQNHKGEKLLVMSSQAYGSLREDQVRKLESYNRILHAPLDNIETNGGGSARCMIAEVFLPVK